VIELCLHAAVPGAVVEVDRTISTISHDPVEGVRPACVWFPLDALVVLAPTTS
jgi:hypothetical protein